MTDFDFSNQDSAANLLRFGLATMQAGGQSGATLGGAIGTGGLNAMDWAQPMPYRRAQLQMMSGQAAGQDLENQLKALTVRGYQDLQNGDNGAPPTAGGAISSSMQSPASIASSNGGGPAAASAGIPSASSPAANPASGNGTVAYPSNGTNAAPLQRIGTLPPQVHDALSASGAPSNGILGSPMRSPKAPKAEPSRMGWVLSSL